ncbi:MAG: zinc-ribbon domain containing protein [Clostridium sp.]|nr:zinc-ribbon domain containing protein [Clostridium sp.]
MTDKTLVCRDCGSEFVFSVGELDCYKTLVYTRVFFVYKINNKIKNRKKAISKDL